MVPLVRLMRIGDAFPVCMSGASELADLPGVEAAAAAAAVASLQTRCIPPSANFSTSSSSCTRTYCHFYCHQQLSLAASCCAFVSAPSLPPPPPTVSALSSPASALPNPTALPVIRSACPALPH